MKNTDGTFKTISLLETQYSTDTTKNESSLKKEILYKFFQQIENSLIFNSTNHDKQKQFEGLFKRYKVKNIIFQSVHVDEPKADDLLIAIYKASKMPKNFMLIEDSSITIEGRKDTGSNIKWFIEKLRKDHSLLTSIIGKKVIIKSVLAFKYNNHVAVSHGKVIGKIVAPSSYPISDLSDMIIPEGSIETYAKSGKLSYDTKFSARAMAVDNLFNGDITTHRLIKKWDGQFQGQN